VYSPAFPRPPRTVVVVDEIEILAMLQLSAVVTAAAAAAAAGTPPPPPLPSLPPPSAVALAVVSLAHEYTMPSQPRLLWLLHLTRVTVPHYPCW
jgi:hypothetical protein